MCFVFIWEQTATCATYSINWLVFITEMKSVYCAVRTGSLNKAVCASSLKGSSAGTVLPHTTDCVYRHSNRWLLSFFCDMTPCGLVEIYNVSGNTYFLLSQGRKCFWSLRFLINIHNRTCLARSDAVGWGRKDAGSIPNVVIGISHWHSRTTVPGSTQPLTEMSTRNISWGVKATGA
jgi:hypothetical protein